MKGIKDAQRIVVKVGTSTLTYDTGKVNLRRMDKLAQVISDLRNSGIEVALVTSAAIAVGVGKLGLPARPKDIPSRQAVATVGQCELMFMYDKLFSEYGNTIGQLLITRSDFESDERRANLSNSFEKLFEFGAIPVINENDSIAVEEIVFGDNDTLSAMVAKLVNALCHALYALCGEGQAVYHRPGHAVFACRRYICAVRLQYALHIFAKG